MRHFGVVEFVLPLVLWTFRIPFCVTARTEDEAPRVIGAPRPIIAAVGDDVILPCHLQPTFNVQRLTVEWSLPDLKPDPSDRLRGVKYVHIYRKREEDRTMKIQSYSGRTSLFTQELTNGNISLEIKNVTLADGGRYRCFIPKLRSRVRQATVRLVVGEQLSRCSVHCFTSSDETHECCWSKGIL
ncbi:butyrophilin subfamily 3 member A2-like [Cottoperca gobio]|uniref:Butyrophilin subfamily 3 member A2-like n=1 Tax=Cottoperca gobio TaxID=56716 RepID=A0A6J2RKK7_COTGO|nr:butyrophilin subfamily 3 member A2-like [Cottoperca gobio]